MYESPHAKIALSLHNLGWYYGGIGDMTLAEQYTTQAIDMRTAVFGEIHPRVAASVSMLSQFYRQQDKWSEAEATARKSVRIASQIFDEGHPDFTFPLYELASVLHAKGKLLEARDLFAQIVAWERVSLGPDNHDLGMSIKAHANVLLDLAEYDEAESLLLESLSIFTALAPGSARSLQNTRTDLGGLYLANGRHPEAAQMLGADRDVVAENFDSPSAMRSRRIELADYYLTVDDLPNAERMLDEMITGTDPDHATLHSEDAELLALRGRVLLAGDQAGAAVEALQQTLGLLIPRWGEEHWQVDVARAQLGRAELDNGDLDAGLSTLAEAYSGLQSSLGQTHPQTLAVAATLRDISTANTTK
jgi:tetratricopeptide (TPR) repeat protein